MLWLNNMVLKQLHLAAINFQLLNLAIWFEIWKWLSDGRAVFGRFVNHIFAFHSSPVLNLISTLNWFDLASLKLKQGQYFFENEMMRHILMELRKYIGKENHQIHQERVISYDSNYVINKVHWVCIRTVTPKSIADFRISCID